jgi:hypothetical protein
MAKQSGTGAVDATATSPSAYEVLVGMDYLAKSGKSVRAEKGDVRDDLPAQSLSWLLELGYIRSTTKKAEG